MFLLNGLEPVVARVIGRLESVVPGAFFFLIGVGMLLMIGVSNRRLMRKLRAELPAGEFAIRRRRGRIALLVVGIMCAAPFVASGLWIWFDRQSVKEPLSNLGQIAINWNRDLIKRVTLEGEKGMIAEFEGHTVGFVNMYPGGNYTIRGFKDDHEVYREHFTLAPDDHYGVRIFEKPEGSNVAGLSIDCQDPTLVIEVRGREREYRLGRTGATVTQGLKVGEKYRLGIARANHVLHAEDITLGPGEHRELHIGRVAEWERRIELTPKNGSFPNDVTQMQIAPDHSAVAVGRFDGPIIVFDAVTGKERFTIERAKSHCTAFGFTPDSRAIAFLAHVGGPDHVLRFVDSRTGEKSDPELKPATTAISNAHALAFSPDGKRLAIASSENFGSDTQFFRSRIIRWEVSRGSSVPKELPTLEWQDGEIKALRFGPNGEMLVAAADQIREWNWKTGTNLPRGGGKCDVLAVGPKSRAFGGWNNNDKLSTISIMSRDESFLPAMPKWPSQLGCLAVSPDGSLVAAGNKSVANVAWEQRAAVRVWDAKTGVERAVLLGHSDWILDLAFSADGREIISASKDGTLRVGNCQDSLIWR